jgi:hypothetical protein
MGCQNGRTETGLCSRGVLRKEDGIGGGVDSAKRIHVLERKKWLDDYHQTLMDLESAKLRGHLNGLDGMLMRIQSLRTIPGLLETERDAITDTVNALGALSQLGDRYDEDQRRCAIARAERELQALAPKIEELDEAASR